MPSRSSARSAFCPRTVISRYGPEPIHEAQAIVDALASVLGTPAAKAARSQRPWTAAFLPGRRLQDQPCTKKWGPRALRCVENGDGTGTPDRRSDVTLGVALSGRSECCSHRAEVALM